MTTARQALRVPFEEARRAARHARRRWVNHRSRPHRAELASVQHFELDEPRVYFYHVRKCAGTSLIHGVLGRGAGGGAEQYERLVSSPAGWIDVDGLVVTGWDRRLIAEGLYHFGFSHASFDEVVVPPRTFTITCLRDPSARVISHYRMLRHLQEHAPASMALRHEGSWLGATFGEFLDRIPASHLCRQLAMFSGRHDLSEAVERLGAIDQVLFVETLDDDIKHLEKRLGLELSRAHEKRYETEVDVTEAERDRMREMLATEYELIESVRPTRSP